MQAAVRRQVYVPESRQRPGKLHVHHQQSVGNNIISYLSILVQKLPGLEAQPQYVIMTTKLKVVVSITKVFIYR